MILKGLSTLKAHRGCFIFAGRCFLPYFLSLNFPSGLCEARVSLSVTEDVRCYFRFFDQMFAFTIV